MKKEALNAGGAVGKSGPKFEQAAKGGSLQTGNAHYEKNIKADDMYARPEAEANQKMPKGHDRI